MIFMTFHILGMSSSQLTFIFFRGVDTTNQMILKINNYGMRYTMDICLAFGIHHHDIPYDMYIEWPYLKLCLFISHPWSSRVGLMFVE